jgi:hypothetical protein
MAWTFYNSSGEAMIEDGAMSIANNTNDRVVTATGADPASLNGEANLTFDGTDLTVGAGNVIIGTAGKGIDFSNQASPASGMASELLDRYEEGVWTPTVNDESNNDSESQAYDAQAGRYTRIGNRVFWNCEVQLNSLGSLTTTNKVRVAGLPFVAINVTAMLHSAVSMRAANLSITALAVVGGLVQINTDYILLRIWDGTTQPDDLLISEFTAAGMINMSGHYEVAS